jgi:hypothetical protein
VRHRDPDKKLFRHRAPDVYSSWALLACDPKYFLVGAPLHWIGSSPTSNGLIYTTKPESDEASDFWVSSADQDDPMADVFDFGTKTPVHLLLMDAALLVNSIFPRRHNSIILNHGFVGAFANEPCAKWRQVRLSVKKAGRSEFLFLVAGFAAKTIKVLRRALRVVSRAWRARIGQSDVIIVRRHEGGEMANIESANALILEKLELGRSF